MRILVTGASGFLGKRVCALLTATGHEVVKASRPGSASTSQQVVWDPQKGTLTGKGCEQVEGVIHLAGENVFGLWTQQKKARIRDSRVEGTRSLLQALAPMPLKVFVSASAIGYYGDTEERVVEEGAPMGAGFLAEVVRQWEEASLPLTERGCRVVHCRYGVILDPSGGALAKMKLPFKLGLGGVLGSGKQYMSWVSLDDAAALTVACLENPVYSGPVNVVAPEAVTNREFTKSLGKALRRPTPFPVPAFALKLLLGQMAEEMLLSSARVYPRVSLDKGFTFRDPQLQPTLSRLLSS